jgi:hypothetical protein
MNLGVGSLFLYRGIGHPWTAEPGWDQMMISADSIEQLREKIAEAENKFWRVWFLSESTIRVHMFKPSGATREWQDVRWQGTPRGHGHQFKVGDEVYTDFASTKTRQRITHHRITDIKLQPTCQTGILLRVTPRVPGSSYVSEGTEQEKGNAWIDSAWFRKVEAVA